MLTTIKLKLKRKCFTKSPRIRFDMEKLKDPKIAEVFQPKVGAKFATLRVIDSDVDTPANSLKPVLLSTAGELFGKQRKKIQLLVANEVLDLCNQKLQLKQQKYTSRTTIQKSEQRSQQEEEMLHGHHQRWDISAHARTSHEGLR